MGHSTRPDEISPDDSGVRKAVHHMAAGRAELLDQTVFHQNFSSLNEAQRLSSRWQESLVACEASVQSRKNSRAP